MRSAKKRIPPSTTLDDASVTSVDIDWARLKSHREDIVEGLTAHVHKVAEELCLSYKTVANYGTQIRTELNISTLTELAHTAVIPGLMKKQIALAEQLLTVKLYTWVGIFIPKSDLASNFQDTVWAEHRLYLLTQSRELPSETTVKQVLLPLLIKQFFRPEQNSIIQQFRFYFLWVKEDSDET